MGQSLQDLEQRLLQSTTDLLNQRAEIQKLKRSIRGAEASKRSRTVRSSSIILTAQASPSLSL
jgi:hypothetical protein